MSRFVGVVHSFKPDKLKPEKSSLRPSHFRLKPSSIFSLRAQIRSGNPSQAASDPSGPKFLPSGRKQWLAFASAAAISAATAVAIFATRSSEELSDVKLVTGVPAIRQSTTGHDLRWHSKDVTILLDKSLDELHPRAKEAVQLGFGAWVATDSKLPTLKFDTTSGTKLSQKPDGKSTVYVADIDIAGHEQDLALTITYSREDTGEIVEADLVFNSKYKFGVLETLPLLKSPEQGPAPKTSDNDRDRDNDDHRDDRNHNAGSDRDNDRDPERSDENAESAQPISKPVTAPHAVEIADTKKCEQRYDVQNVATHEVGHFFGLGEDPTETYATMFKRVARCEVHKRHLALTDESAAEKLYSEEIADNEAEETTSQGCGGAQLGTGALPNSGTALGLALGLFAFGAARRRRR